MRLSRPANLCFLALIASAGAFVPNVHAGPEDVPDAKDMKTMAEIRPADPADPRIWIAPEYIHYWQNGTANTPNLLTQAPAEGANALAIPGMGGGITNAFGPQRIHFKDGNGARLTMGMWIDKEERFGVEVSGFYIPRQTQSTSINSDGMAIAAPYNDFNPAGPGLATIPFAGEYDNSSGAAPNPTSGSASFRATTEEYGGEANFMVRTFDMKPVNDLRIKGDSFLGFRYFGLQDEFDDSYQGQIFLPATVGEFGASDRFRTNNNFYGANLGAHFRADYHHFFAELTPKIALGMMDESVDVDGSSFSTVSGIVDGFNVGTSGNPGGLYATGNKLGSRSQDKFAYIPQLTVKLGYDLTSWADLFIAYDALYVSDLARAVSQIDTNIDSGTGALGNYYPTGAGSVFGAPDHSPAPGVVSSTMFEQGITAGLTFKL